MARAKSPPHPEGAKRTILKFVEPLLKIFLIIFGIK